MSKTETMPGLHALRATPEQKNAAAVALGRIRTEKKSAASARNGFKPGNPGSDGRKPKLLSELACACNVGDALEGHKWDCPRGQAIIRRRKAGTL